MRPLPALTPSAIESMISQLRTRGFACISVQPNDRPWIQNALQLATSHLYHRNNNRHGDESSAAAMGEFRFPPLEGPIVYAESRRQAFRALFEVATACFSGLLTPLMSTTSDGDSFLGHNVRDVDPKTTSSAEAAGRTFACALDQARGKESCSNASSSESFSLFHPDENEPFEPGQAFSHSFFNQFNYNHGSLNAHVDRSLLTVIYTTAAQDNNNLQSGSSALWVKDTEGTWHNADRAVQRDQVIVMVGEDLEKAGIASRLGLFAAEHAVRVDPSGLHIERSHFRRDPSCADGVRNRLSVAMNLRHEISG